MSPPPSSPTRSTPCHLTLSASSCRDKPVAQVIPTERDLRIPHGIILNTGRSALSDDRKLIQFATSTFNSGKATPIVNMPEDNPCHISPLLAQRLGLKNGDTVRITGRYNGAAVDLPVVVTDRVKGEMVYVSFHKSRAQMERGVYINDVTHHLERCSYCSQVSVKVNQVFLERLEARAALEVRGAAAPAIIRRREDLRLDTTLLDPKLELPIWTGQGTPLYVTDIIQETHDAFTFRFQGDPLCRFVYWPGQFCTLVLNIDGRKVVRSYTISSSPTRPFLLDITVKRVPGGVVSNWLVDNLKVGDRVEIAGPKGKFYLAPGKVPPKILLIAAGSGITPMLSMARWLCDVAADVDVRFFNSVRSPKDIIFHKEIEWMTSRYKQFHPVIVTTSREWGSAWTGFTGRVSRAILEMVASDLPERQVYMCGPAGFMEAVENLLREMGCDMSRLHTESFGGIRTSVANKSSPLGTNGAVETELTAAAEPAAPAGQLTVEFARTGTIARTDGRLPLLDLAEAYDVDMDYGCRTGGCGDCKARLLKGEVRMTNEEGLESQDRAAGYILTCVARPKTDCVIDA
ncbi:MAG TPA: FAD-binding oxidoreductase [Burkholderiales bacterium]|nr:FAD-binding oxidoreductase [Burkholderiales bacterium]